VTPPPDSLPPLGSSKASLNWTSWIYGLLLPLVYLVVELSFSNELIHTLGDHSPDDVLTGFEFWGRAISGCGLGLLIHRLIGPRLPAKGAIFVTSIAAGIVVMWNVQKTLIDYLIDVAEPADKRAALALVWVAPTVGDGLLRTMAGQSVTLAKPEGVNKHIVVSLFPAAALHAKQRDEQLAQWVSGVGNFGAPGGILLGATAELEDRAYRALIVAPLVVGLSLSFALLNLSVALSFLIGLYRPRWRPFAATAMVALLIAVSLSPRNLMLHAEAYESNLRAALWAEKPLLALIVEWSARASTQWSPASELVHRHLLLGYSFKPVL